MKQVLPLFLLLSFFFANSLSAQNCGTRVEDADLSILRQLNERWRQEAGNSSRSVGSLTMIPVQLHIIRSSAGTGGISPVDLEIQFDLVNEYYLPANMHFFQCGPINYIDDDTYANYDFSEMAALDAAHSVPNVLNVYVADDVTSGATPICGHAQFPGGLDFIMLATSCAVNGSTFAHEIGHYLGLYHTHEPFFGAELVNGSNCASAADQVCDTPADPTLTGANHTVNGCTYTGAAVDANGDPYNPQIENIMSYAYKECRINFTPLQIDRMRLTLTNFRAYLSCGNVLPLDAEFYAAPVTGCGNTLNVQFATSSEGPVTTYDWDMGDGTLISGNGFPNHTYANPGLYNVSLTVGDGSSTDTRFVGGLVNVGSATVPFFEDFETGPAALNRYYDTATMRNSLRVAGSGANNGSFGLVMEGWPDNSNSPYFITPTLGSAFDDLVNPYFKSSFEICVDATAATNLDLYFDLRQLFGFDSNYTNLRVLANGIVVGGPYQADGTETWQNIYINLDPLAGTNFTLTFEGSHKYTEGFSGANGNATYIDNIQLNGSSVLTVVWEQFLARKEGKAVQLDWQTSQEENNLGFDILRSADGETWQRIGFVSAKGQGSAKRQYSFTDWDLPSTRDGYLYYQLEQKDLNGEINPSEIRQVWHQAGTDMQLFPNPLRGDLLTIDAGISNHATQHLRIFDLAGHLQMEKVVESANPNRLEVNLEDLPPGVYLVNLVSAERVSSQRLIRQ